MGDTIKSLRAERDALQAEVEALRAWRDSHVCAPAPVAQRCTCPLPGAANPVASPCPVHSWPHGTWTGYVSPPNVCGGGAAGIAQTYTVLPGDRPLNIAYQTQGAAGCAANTLLYPVPAG